MEWTTVLASWKSVMARAAQAADAALLVASLGEAVVDRCPCVRPDGAYLDLAADPAAATTAADAAERADAVILALPLGKYRSTPGEGLEIVEQPGVGGIAPRAGAVLVGRHDGDGGAHRSGSGVCHGDL